MNVGQSLNPGILTDAQPQRVRIATAIFNTFGKDSILSKVCASVLIILMAFWGIMIPIIAYNLSTNAKNILGLENEKNKDFLVDIQAQLDTIKKQLQNIHSETPSLAKQKTKKHYSANNPKKKRNQLTKTIKNIEKSIQVDTLKYQTITLTKNESKVVQSNTYVAIECAKDSVTLFHIEIKQCSIVQPDISIVNPPGHEKDHYILKLSKSNLQLQVIVDSTFFFKTSIITTPSP